MSATGTPTPNIGLRRPQGTDPASVDDINYNSALLDTKLGAVGNTSLQDQIDTLSTNTAQNLGKVQDGLAIVANGNTHVAIPADYYVYVKGHNSLSEGLYKNTSGSTIAANATLSTSNLTADDDGGLNSVYSTLNGKINGINDYSANTEASISITSDDDFHNVSSLNLQKGLYLIIGKASFPNNTTGSRGLSLSLNNTADSAWFVNLPAATTGSTAMQVMRVHEFISQGTINLLARQNSGNSQSVTARIFAIKLK